ncbi:6-hydroxycyclohex-1-ene-1-carbonyl-CoA dehydrogenase [Myxococcota bacterium]|nr:6-hydroxycyclohex-1-ene-1-carbonyl-CoA dehydrogenase [Myxococcota bacterium]
MVEIHSWKMTAPKEPLTRATASIDPGALAPGDILVEIAGCGVCHTDLGYLFGGVKTKHALPLTLGHEISGVVVGAGDAMRDLLGEAVVVPAVIPCGECALCKKGKGSICRKQIFPGNDVDGGFASHVVVPGRGLCKVDRARLAAQGLELADVAVLADAISTPYQAIVRSGLAKGDVAIFVGAGGVGGFGVQLAAALGAHVVAIDIDEKRLAKMEAHGAELVVDSKKTPVGDVRKLVQKWVEAKGYSPFEHKIFETSGHPAGQELAFSLLGFGAYLGVVGFTLEKTNVRMSNLMAFDATAQGNWGCLPELYPPALDLVLSGAVKLGAFVERTPMSGINDLLHRLEGHGAERRPVLVPDFGR